VRLSAQLSTALGEELGALHLHPGRRKKKKKAKVDDPSGTFVGAGDKKGRGTPGHGYQNRHKSIPI
jgi:hypothetical protein